MKRKKRIRYESNVAELRKLKEMLGLEVLQFSQIHLRVIGKNVVDYWPSTGKGWLIQSDQKGRPMTVAEVCELAAGPLEILPDGARDHMESLH